MILPGEIYLAEVEQAGPHPVIVLSREELNRGRYVLAVFCTSKRFATRSTLPTCVPFRAGHFGFTTDCVAQCDNLTLIEVADLHRRGGPIGVLDHSTLREVIKAVGYVMDSDCEPT